jgi:hypothetical protein
LILEFIWRKVENIFGINEKVIQVRFEINLFIFKDMVRTFKFICMHPEVKDIGFLILLYAGTIYKYSFKDYSITFIVKNLKLLNLSADNNSIIAFFAEFNIYNNRIEISEALCNKI